jgi:uncharacterized flavoprotein (TIGR03862 family)
MKAAPLLRAWLHRLREAGVQLHVRHRWLGFGNADALRLQTPAGDISPQPDAVVLALGGGSWAKLGSDGAWVPLLQQRGVSVAPLQAANCGFERAWSEMFRQRFAGEPLKTVALSLTDAEGQHEYKRGECVVTGHGVEGSLIYAFSARIRELIMRNGSATVLLDLLPDRDAAKVLEELARPRGSRSISSHLQSRLGLKGVKASLLRELLDADSFANPARLAAAIKALPLTLHAARPIDEAISSAGGVSFEALDSKLMLKQLPGIFCAGEMLDWEAPTGGYLLTAPFLPMSRAEMEALGWDSAMSSSSPAMPMSTTRASAWPSSGDCSRRRVSASASSPAGLVVGRAVPRAGPAAAVLRRHRRQHGFDGQPLHLRSSKIRSDDAYTPGGEAGKRPDRSVIVYSQRCARPIPACRS